MTDAYLSSGQYHRRLHVPFPGNYNSWLRLSTERDRLLGRAVTVNSEQGVFYGNQILRISLLRILHEIR